jgi:hypothetical protein
MVAVRPCPATSVAVIEARLGVTSVAWAIAFHVVPRASTPLSVLLGPTVTCQSSAGHGPVAWEWKAKTLPGGTADWAIAAPHVVAIASALATIILGETIAYPPSAQLLSANRGRCPVRCPFGTVHYLAHAVMQCNSVSASQPDSSAN